MIFVWQPTLFAKTSLAGDEARILADLEINNPNFIELYQNVDALVREQVTENNIDNIIVLTDHFADSEEAIFFDLVHITEIGNLSVAEAILPNNSQHIRKLNFSKGQTCQSQ